MAFTKLNILIYVKLGAVIAVSVGTLLILIKQVEYGDCIIFHSSKQNCQWGVGEFNPFYDELGALVLSLVLGLIGICSFLKRINLNTQGV